MSAAALRQRAMICAAEAAAADSVEERDALLRKRASLLALADTEDWLGGEPPFHEKIPQSEPSHAALQAAE